ncbi:hypothetical protein SHKM778_66570 [Streptomyces sp. KM77-8]|uniref:Uncharacterized protein n=1 Tax=Streptomyces haneummycinicus TaxID=3074435 RepID=A0AAT9HSA6_9ACTN
MRFSLGDVLARGGRGAGVDGREAGAGPVGIDVGENPGDAGHGALGVRFPGAEEGMSAMPGLRTAAAGKSPRGSGVAVNQRLIGSPVRGSSRSRTAVSGAPARSSM